jgi:hypothetical protein
VKYELYLCAHGLATDGQLLLVIFLVSSSQWVPFSLSINMSFSKRFVNYAIGTRTLKWCKYSVGMPFLLWWQTPLPQLFQLVVQKCIYWALSLCALMINLCDHFSLFLRIFAHNLVTEDNLSSANGLIWN